MLPETFSPISITDGDKLTWQVVVERNNPPPYDRWVIDYRHYSDIARILRKLLGGDGTLIDLGANLGTVSLPISAAGNRVLAIEMLPRNVAKLSMAVMLNRCPGFRVVHTAVSDRDGFIGYQGSEAWGHISNDVNAYQTVCQRLDSIVDIIELENPSFIRGEVAMKLDIEGHELAALKGASRVLERYRPCFIFESNLFFVDSLGPNADNLKRLVADAGYEMFMIRGRTLNPHPVGERQIGLVCDILAVPREKLGMLSLLGTDYVIRDLTQREEIDWLLEMAREVEGHRVHAEAMVEYLGLMHPEMKEDLAGVTREIWIQREAVGNCATGIRQ